MFRSQLQFSRGITLIELMVVIAIIGILFGLAAPNFSSFIEDRAIASEVRRVSGLLKLARNEARTRAATVTMAKSGTHWAGDVQLYQDATGGGNSPYDASEDELFREDEGTDRVRVNASSEGDDWISFTSRGWLNESADITLSVCDRNGNAENGHYIKVNRVGKVSTKRINGDGPGCNP